MTHPKHPLTDEAIAEFFPADDTPEGRAELRRQFDAMMAEREAQRLPATGRGAGARELRPSGRGSDQEVSMKLKAKIAPHSSVVGGGVHIIEADGRFAGQIAFLCQTDTLRDSALQGRMAAAIVGALNQLFAEETRHD